MTEDMYAAITRVAREFRAYRYMIQPEHPQKHVGDLVHDEWNELWRDLDTLQREWLE